MELIKEYGQPGMSSCWGLLQRETDGRVFKRPFLHLVVGLGVSEQEEELRTELRIVRTSWNFLTFLHLTLTMKEQRQAGFWLHLYRFPSPV